jgi:hypothetical protein
MRTIFRKHLVAVAILGFGVATGGLALADRGGPWSGVIGYWRANQSTEDLSGHIDSHETPPIPLVQGIQGRAFHFDGATSLDTTYDPVINAQAVTIGFWARPTVTSTGCCQGLVSAENYLVETQVDNGVMFFARNAQGLGQDTIFYGGAPPLPVNQWTHVVAVYDGEAMRLYINGVPFGVPAPLAGSLMANASNGFLSIGSEDGRTECVNCPGTRRFTGDMDEIVVLNYAMTPEEIQVMYRQGVLASLGH